MSSFRLLSPFTLTLVVVPLIALSTAVFVWAILSAYWVGALIALTAMLLIAGGAVSYSWRWSTPPDSHVHNAPIVGAGHDAERLQTLSQIGLELNKSLDANSIIKVTAVQLQELVHFDALSLLLVGEDPTRFTLSAYQPVGSEIVKTINEQVPSTTLEKRIIETKSPLIVDDTAEEEHWDHTLQAQPDIRSWIGVPMIVQGQVMGLINLSSRHPGQFTNEDMHLVLIFANQSAIALTNARLYEQAQQEIEVRTVAESALRESESRFRSLYETMTQGVYYRNLHGRVVSANSAALQILGQTLEGMNNAYNTNMPRPVLKEDGTPFQSDEYPTFVAMQSSKTVRNTLMRIYNPQEETYRWIILDAVPQFRPGEKQPYQVYAIFRDVTEQRLAKQALEASEQRFRSLFETMSQGVIYRDRHGRVIDANPAISQMFGLDVAGLQQEYDQQGIEWRIFDEWNNP